MTDLKYFTFTPTVFTDNLNGGITHSGYIIQVNSDYNEGHLKGKITLPVTYMNEPIIELYGFNDEYGMNITHIFFDNSSIC